MVVVLFRTIFALLYVAMFAATGFVYGRLPKPSSMRVHQLVGMVLFPLGFGLSHAPWAFRVGAACASLVAVGVAWYFGAREREREGFPPFAHPALPEGHKPTLRERARRLYTPMRWMFGFVAYFTLLVLFLGDVGTRSERRAHEQAGCVEGRDVSR